jgi:hypothetical protein
VGAAWKGKKAPKLISVHISLFSDVAMKAKRVAFQGMISFRT